MLSTRQQIEKRVMKVGRKEGKKENQKEMAERMLKAGEPQEKVIQFTGLPAKEVAAISDRLNRSKE